MELKTVACGSCGASLALPDGAKFVTCRHCGSSLRVQSNHDVVFTEVMETLRQHSDQLSKNTEMLRVQNELKLLDQEWEHEVSRLMIRDSKGNQQIPSRMGSVVGGAILIAFGVLWTLFATAAFPPMGLFGLLFLGVGIFSTIRAYNSAHRFEEVASSLELKRGVLKSQLERLRDP